jgi:hypothetical protein
MRQDKFIKLLSIQLRRYHLPSLVSSQSDSPEIWTIAYPAALVENPLLLKALIQFELGKKTATSSQANGDDLTAFICISSYPFQPLSLSI